MTQPPTSGLSTVKAAPPTPPAGGARTLDRRTDFGDIVSKYSMIGVLVVLVIVAEVAYPGFLAWGSVLNVLTNATPVGLVAIGMTFVLIGGGFDLSVAGTFAVSGVLFASFSNIMPVGAAFALVIPIAVAMGVLNGLIITRLHVNAFVATLGTSSIFTGAAFLINVSGAVTVARPDFPYIGTAVWLGVPAMIWILAICFVLGGVVLAKTVFGRSVYIVGGNADAARLSGMRVGLIQATTYALTAVAAAFAGMLLASQTSVGQANVGVTITLDSIAIVIIGGTSLRGGQGSMWRTLVGLLIIATIDSVFDSLALNSSVQSVAKGAIVIIAVALDAWSQRRK